MEPGAAVIEGGFTVNQSGVPNAAGDIDVWLGNLGYQEAASLPMKNGFITEQILNGESGEIHYSYYLPENYDTNKSYPLMVTMPGYDAMWFGEESSGRNLDWRGALVWTEREEEIIVVSARLTDWGETSARQALELTEYMIHNFAVDPARVYAAGYSAGGETMSRAVYIFMAENDEYYGSQKAREAYQGLYDAYQKAGIAENHIAEVLHLQIPDDEYFNSRGIYNYHSGGNILFEEKSIQDWILS